MPEQMFPVLDVYAKRERYEALGCPKRVPWALLEPHEQQAKDNHGQTLKRLAERGGLSPKEMASVLLDKKWRYCAEMSDEKAVTVILNALAEDGP